MGLFNRRKRDEPAPEAAEAELDELDGDREPLDGPATWYRAMDVNPISAGDDVLLHDPDRAAPVVLPTFELDLLAHCTPFAPVEAHAAAAARRTGLPADGVAQRLYEFVDRGLLVSQQAVMARARAAAEADTNVAPTLDRVAVITADRPTSLANCLRSYRERYGADIELIVFDDSADAGTRAENRRVAAQAAAGGRILYAGEEEKRRFVTELAARSGVETDVVRAAFTEFDGCAYHCGANRNAALLDAAGGAVLLVDDDTTARATRQPDAGDGLRVSSRPDPWSLHFFPTVEDALGAADWQDVDLIAWHRRFLGMSPAACAFGPAARGTPLPLDSDGSQLDLNEADAALLGSFARGRGRVVVTGAGLAGDSGMGPSLYFLWVQGPAHERLLEDYESHRVTRAVHRGADVATISNTAFLMAPNLAVDVRTTIPPFSPVLRNSDGAFGGMLRTCAPEFYVGFLPWSVEHTPPHPRSADFKKVLRSVAWMGANDIIRDLAHSYEPAPGVADPAMRLRAFGRYLAALGTMPAADFDALIAHRIMIAAGRRIDVLTRVVDQEEGQPAQWAEDCGAAVREGLRTLTENSENSLVTPDMPGATPDEKQRRLQRLLYRFGGLIDAWPELLHAAADLRMAQPLAS